MKYVDDKKSIFLNLQYLSTNSNMPEHFVAFKMSRLYYFYLLGIAIFSGTGICDMCLPGYYYFNKNCEPCRGTCLQLNATDDYTCDPNDGTCLYGCINSWYGEQCHWGCSPLCVNKTCTRDDGCCTVDYCKYDFYGGCK